MYFVLKQVRITTHILQEQNLRMGGFKTREAAFKAAKRQSVPCLVKDYSRNIVGQTLSSQHPKWIA